jgi:hypothetical protein
VGKAELGDADDPVVVALQPHVLDAIALELVGRTVVLIAVGFDDQPVSRPVEVELPGAKPDIAVGWWNLRVLVAQPCGEVTLERRRALGRVPSGRAIAGKRGVEPLDPAQAVAPRDRPVDLVDVEQPAAGQLGEEPVELLVGLAGGGFEEGERGRGCSEASMRRISWSSGTIVVRCTRRPW